MHQQGIPLSRNAIHCLLQACTKKKDLAVGRQVHSFMIIHGLESVAFLGDYLIRLYAVCGTLLDVDGVFYKISNPSVYTWNAIIDAHAKLGDYESALEFCYEMQQKGVKPDKFTFLCTLKACSSIKALFQGRLIHDASVKSGLHLDLVLMNTLIDMYAKCGSLGEASNVFAKLQNRDVVSWSALIAGHVTHGDGLRALELFYEMQDEGMKPHIVILVCVLKACGSIGAIVQGQLIHDQIIRSGLELDAIVGSTLVDMYAKCGFLTVALFLFDKLAIRDVVSWAAIIAGYTVAGHGLTALKLFGDMQKEGIKPDNVIFSCILKACGSIRAVGHGRWTHGHIVRIGLDVNVVVGSTLVDMYVKCGSLEEAHEVFNNLQNRNVVSWGVMMSAYILEGCDLYALEVFEEMEKAGIMPDKVIFAGILKVCECVGAMRLGKLIHDQIISHGFESDVVIRNAIIYMYTNCGNIDEAHSVFYTFPNKDTESWSIIIVGCSQHGYFLLALELFGKMLESISMPDKTLFLCTLQACGRIAAIRQGRIIHDQIIKNELELHSVVASALVDMYIKSGSLEEAFEVFNSLSHPDVVTWGAMIAGYAQQGYAVSALELFEKMQQDGIRPDRLIILCIFKACGQVRAKEQGYLTHDQTVRIGQEIGLEIGNSLVDMYAKCGCIEEACRVFDNLQHRDVVSWGTMMTGYVQNGQDLCCLELFGRLQQEGLKPDTVLYSCILKACGSIKALRQGMLLHDQIITGGLESDAVVGCALVGMYNKCGNCKEAHNVFAKIPKQDLVSWDTMIAGYAVQGHGHLALEIFGEMKQQFVNPGKATFMWILKAIGSMSAMEQGRLLHNYIVENGMESDTVVGKTLVEMYAKCGSLDEACKIFNELRSQDVVCWGIMMAGSVLHGNYRLVLKLVEDMQRQGLRPDEPIFTTILGACSHGGLVEEGLLYFKSMKKDYGIAPSSEHYSCIVDLLGRAGCLSIAEDVIQTMPTPHDIITWTSLLSNCKTYGDIELGRKCFKHLLGFDASNASGYVLMENIYAHAHRREDAEKMQESRSCRGAWKKAGRAWIEVNKKVSDFLIGGKSHPDADDIFSKLDRMCVPMKEEGYMPQCSLV